MNYSIGGWRIAKTGWLNPWDRRNRLHHALKANYDTWPEPPMRWHRNWVKVDNRYGRISETGWFEPSARLNLYPAAWLPMPPDPLNARRR